MALIRNEQFGISFSLKSGSILLYKSTLQQLGNPECFRLLLNIQKRTLAVQVCEYGVPGSHRVNKRRDGDGHFCFRSMKFVRLLYDQFGWERNAAYRMMGIAHEDLRLISYNLNTAEKGRYEWWDMLVQPGERL